MKKNFVTKCSSTKIIGGFKVGGAGIWFERDFDLPAHKRLTIRLKAFAIDAWENEKFIISVDGV